MSELYAAATAITRFNRAYGPSEPLHRVVDDASVVGGFRIFERMDLLEAFNSVGHDRHTHVEPAAHRLAASPGGRERPLIHGGDHGVIQTRTGLRSPQQADARRMPAVRDEHSNDDDLVARPASQIIGHGGLDARRDPRGASLTSVGSKKGPCGAAGDGAVGAADLGASTSATVSTGRDTLAAGMGSGAGGLAARGFEGAAADRRAAADVEELGVLIGFGASAGAVLAGGAFGVGAGEAG